MVQYIDVKCFTVGIYGVNCYVVGDDKKVMIIDMGALQYDFAMFDKAINGRKLERIVYTHGHIDHIAGSDEARKYYKNVKHYIHYKDKIMFSNPKENLSSFISAASSFAPPEETFEDNDTFKIGTIDFKVIHTPGHSPGSVCYYTEGYLFCGDTLFAEGVGRTDFPHGNEEQLYHNLNKKIFTLPDETLYFPGHQTYGCILAERKPF